MGAPMANPQIEEFIQTLIWKAAVDRSLRSVGMALNWLSVRRRVPLVVLGTRIAESTEESRTVTDRRYRITRPVTVHRRDAFDIVDRVYKPRKI